jgi:hypothetical protein
MRRGTRQAIFCWPLLLLAVVLTGCNRSGAVTPPANRPAAPAGTSLTDLHAVGDLQARFDQDAGRPRLLMLVSPT